MELQELLFREDDVVRLSLRESKVTKTVNDACQRMDIDKLLESKVNIDDITLDGVKRQSDSSCVSIGMLNKTVDNKMSGTTTRKYGIFSFELHTHTHRSPYF